MTRPFPFLCTRRTINQLAATASPPPQTMGDNHSCNACTGATPSHPRMLWIWNYTFAESASARQCCNLFLAHLQSYGNGGNGFRGLAVQSLAIQTWAWLRWQTSLVTLTQRPRFVFAINVCVRFQTKTTICYCDYRAAPWSSLKLTKPL